MDNLLRPVRVAELLGVSTRTLRRMVADGRFLPPLRLGAVPRWERADVEAFRRRLVEARQVSLQREGACSQRCGG